MTTKDKTPKVHVKHDMPSGGWVGFRNGDHLRARDVKAVVAAVDARKLSGLSTNEVGFAVADELIRLMVVEWDFPYESETGEWLKPSSDPDTIEDLRAADYNRLRALIMPFAEILYPDPESVADETEPAAEAAPAESPTPPAAGPKQSSAGTTRARRSQPNSDDSSTPSTTAGGSTAGA